MEKIKLFKKRDFGETVGTAFDLLRDNFPLIVRCFFILVMPLLTLSLILLVAGEAGRVSHRLHSYLTETNSADNAALIGGYILLCLTIFIETVAVHEIVIAYEHSEDPGQLRVADVWAYIRSDMRMIVHSFFGLIPMWAIFFLTAALLVTAGNYISPSAGGLGILLAYLAYIYTAVCMSHFMMLRLRSEYSVVTSFAKSFSITYGRWWRTLGVHFTLILVGAGFYSVCMLPFFIYGLLMGMHRIEPGDNTTVVASCLGVVFAGVVITCVFNLILLGVSVNYYSLIEEKEHVGLQISIGEIGTPDPSIKMHEGEY